MKAFIASVSIIYIGLLLYLILPPIIQLHTVLDNKPKLMHKPAIVKNLKPNKSPVIKKQTGQTVEPSTTSSKPIPVEQQAPTPKKDITPTTTKVVTKTPGTSVGSLTPSSTSSTTTSSTTSPTSSPTTSSTSSPTPSSTISFPPAVSYNSTNWSGYLSDYSSVKYTVVSGQWVIPNPTGNGTSTTADATWVGIGGVTTNDLIQIGTEDNVTSSGKVYSAAFYELLPNASVQIPSLNVVPGDTISASISETSSNEWSLTITDDTSNQTYTTTLAYTSSLSSAEWIEEDPSSVNGSLLPLDNFGTVPFSNAFTTVNGESLDLSAINADNVTMVNSTGQNIAVPSAISSNGSSFSVTREN
jgi:hypothetical protein